MTGPFDDENRELAEERESLNPVRSPEWHLAEAEEHLVEADVLASSGALAEATARLLAASANANIAALKVALRQEQLLHELREQSHVATSLLDTIQHKTT